MGNVRETFLGKKRGGLSVDGWKGMVTKQQRRENLEYRGNILPILDSRIVPKKQKQVMKKGNDISTAGEATRT